MRWHCWNLSSPALARLGVDAMAAEYTAIGGAARRLTALPSGEGFRSRPPPHFSAPSRTSHMLMSWQNALFFFAGFVAGLMVAIYLR